MKKLKLPNFLIVGAAKSGTSSLHNYLNQHPNIFMPTFNSDGIKVKEPRFLISKLVKDRLHSGTWTFEEYQKLFTDCIDYQAVGESTVLYLYYYEEAIKNIKKYLGQNVKIIIMLRNPIDRAYSAYNFVVRRGIKEKLSFEEALKQEKDRLYNNYNMTPMVMYKEMGLYYKMVESYMKNFQDVHIIFYDEFKKNTSVEISKVFAFLNVSVLSNIDSSKRYNVGGQTWRFQWARAVFLKKSIFKRYIPRIVKNTIIKNLLPFLIRKSNSINKKTKEYLIDFFRDDINKLSKLLKKDLQHWLEI
ncbi:MAG: sulfotransferase domain-containing protein [Bacteroidota bacterium]|nr:sulfotransferase domain-containing protein [Bacteroidota bacterium]